MSKGKDKEDSFIAKLDKLEEAGKARERTGLEEFSSIQMAMTMTLPLLPSAARLDQ